MVASGPPWDHIRSTMWEMYPPQLQLKATVKWRKNENVSYYRRFRATKLSLPRFNPPKPCAISTSKHLHHEPHNPPPASLPRGQSSFNTTFWQVSYSTTHIFCSLLISSPLLFFPYILFASGCRQIRAASSSCLLRSSPILREFIVYWTMFTYKSTATNAYVATINIDRIL
jgi:hypothetical protein